MFGHIFAKIPRHTSQNARTEGELECILTRNCEGTEQLRRISVVAYIVPFCKACGHEMPIMNGTRRIFLWKKKTVSYCLSI